MFEFSLIYLCFVVFVLVVVYLVELLVDLC